MWYPVPVRSQCLCIRHEWQMWLSFLRKCHSHNTQELVWAAERVKIRSGKTNDWFIEHIKIMIRFKDKTVSLTKHLMITALFYFQYFFYELTVYFAKTYFLTFPPTIKECIEALESIPSHGNLLPATCGKENTCDKYGYFHVQIILQWRVQRS